MSGGPRCTRAPYVDKEQAYLALKIIQRKGIHPARRVYRCFMCYSWHITKMEKTDQS